MNHSAKQLLDDINVRKFGLVYLLQGEETFYIDLISGKLESEVLTESEKPFNQIILYGRDASVSSIIGQVRRFPVMAPRQVVIVREAQDVPDLTKEPGQKMMINYLNNPNPSSILVLCHKHKTISKHTELGKIAEKLTISATFKKLYENQMPEFVRTYIADKGYLIDSKSVDILSQSIGTDCTRLANEIDKLILGLKEGEKNLRPEYVMNQVGISREFNIFELQQALISKNIFKSFQIVKFFIENPKKNPPIPLVAFLFSFFSKLFVAVSLSVRSERGLMELLKISPYSAKSYIVAMKNYSQPSLLKNITLLKEADLKLKGVKNVSPDGGQILKELIAGLLR